MTIPRLTQGKVFKTSAFLIGILVSSVFPLGENVNFDSSLYKGGGPVVNHDAWVAYNPTGGLGTGSPNQNDLQVVNDTGSNMVLRCVTDQHGYGASRPFPPTSTGSDIVEVRWKWRANGGDSTSLCLGLLAEGTLRQTERMKMCFENGGTITFSGANLSTQTWSGNSSAWSYVKIHADIGVLSGSTNGVYSIYANADSTKLDSASSLVYGPASMQGTGTLSSLFLSTPANLFGGNSNNSIDIDNIAWFGWRYNIWGASGATNINWYSTANWSRAALPDSNDIVVFAPAYRTGGGRSCNLNFASATTGVPRARVLGIYVDKSYSSTLTGMGTFNLSNDTLTVLQGADLSGGAYTSSGGVLRFAYPTAQTLVDSGNTNALPPILMAGPGLLTLGNNSSTPMSLASYTQTGGGLNLGSVNPTITGDFRVTYAPNPIFPSVTGLQKLAGRTLTVGGNATFLGQDTLNRISLSGDSPWYLKMSTGTVSARYATVKNSKVSFSSSTTKRANAAYSVNGSLDSNWIFWVAPKASTTAQTVFHLVGQTAQFNVASVPASVDSVSYQWQRYANGTYTDVAGATAATYSLSPVAKKDSGSIYDCRVANFADTARGGQELLSVRFPKPNANPPSDSKFSDSLNVTLSDSASLTKIYYTLNHGATQTYASALVLRDSTTLVANAVSGTDTSPSATFVYSKSANPKAAMPTASPPAGAYPDTFSVTLASGNADSILYTKDNSPMVRYDPAIPILIRSTTGTTTVKARTYKTGFSPSDTMASAYTILARSDSIPPPTMSAVPGNIFFDTATVTLFAPSDYPQADIYYRLDNGALIHSSGAAISITNNTTLKATAVSGGKAGRDTSWTFTKGLAAPVFKPKAVSPATEVQFPDQLVVKLQTNASTPAGAKIFYTINGKTPDTASAFFTDSGSITLDTSMNINAFAYLGGLRSATRTERYVLTPNAPQMNPPTGTTSADSTQVFLSSTAKKARIYYSLDGIDPGPTHFDGFVDYNGPVILPAPPNKGTVVLKAVAVAQDKIATISPVTVGNFTFIDKNSQTILAPGDSVVFGGNYQIKNTGTGTTSATLMVLASDTITAPGFVVQFALNLKADSSAAFPNLKLTKTVPDSFSLYSVTGNSVRYLGSGNGQVVKSGGLYFVGLDTLPPVISFSKETVVGDSTSAPFTISDNVDNLNMTVVRSDRADKSDSISSPHAQTFMLKNPGGAPRALTLRITVGDGHNTSVFPPPPQQEYSLAQSLPMGSSPSVWYLGQSQDRPWDMVGLPFDLKPGLTLKDLRTANPKLYLKAMTYDPLLPNLYHEMADADVLLAGQSFWLASNVAVTALKFPSLTTAAMGDTSQRIPLKHKQWNMVSSRRLDTLFWPVTRRNPGYSSLALSDVHGLLGYNRNADSSGGFGYANADTLFPWRGYWVWYGGDRDTLLTLLTTPPAVAKTSANVFTVGFSLIPNHGIPLYLGAGSGFSDGFGREDEPMIPAPTGPPSASLLRGNQMLMTDQIAFHATGALEWHLVLNQTGNASLAKVSSDSANWYLPDGYEVWAVSSKRGLRFQLKPGGMQLQNPSGFSDTLQVLAAPSAWITSHIGNIPTQIGELGHHLYTRSGQWILSLQWPDAGSLRAEVFNSSGRRLATMSQNLPAGYYDFPLDIRDNRGMLYLRITGRSGPRNINWTERGLAP